MATTKHSAVPSLIMAYGARYNGLLIKRWS